MPQRDAERVGLVIGGASGIGWAVAKGLAAEGCRVTVADLNADGAVARAAELGPPHAGAAVDVTDEDTVAALFSGTGPLDVVVNTAGIGGVGRITELPVEQFRSVVEVCLIGAFIVTKHAGRHLRDGGAGRHAAGRRRRRAVLVLRQGVVGDRRGARPQRRGASQAVSGCVGPLRKDVVSEMIEP